jgi:hypothetical protein
VNGGTRDDYTRLRVRVDNFQIKPEGKPVGDLVYYVNKIFAHLTSLQNQIDTHEADQTPHSSTATPAPNRLPLYGPEGGLKSGKAPTQLNDVVRKEELDNETSARILSDTQLQENIDTETGDRIAGDNTLQSNLEFTKTVLTTALQAEGAQRARADDVESKARNIAESRLNQNVKTETKRARYAERSELLMRIQSNLTLTNEFNSLYDLTMNTAADMIRLVDNNTYGLGSTYERKLDKGYGSKVLREADHLDLFNANYVTEDEFNLLYDWVMSTSGMNILQVDVTGSMERKPNRTVDMELPDGQEEQVRILDENQTFGDIEWVDL